MRDQRGMTDLGHAPGAPLLPAVSSGADSELIINVGVYVQYNEFRLRAYIYVLKMIGRTFTELEPIILGSKVIIHLRGKGFMLGRSQTATSFGITAELWMGAFGAEQTGHMLNMGWSQEGHRKYDIIISLLFLTELCVFILFLSLFVFFLLHWVFIAALGFSCPLACGILVPWSGTESASPPLAGGFLTTGLLEVPEPCAL